MKKFLTFIRILFFISYFLFLIVIVFVLGLSIVATISDKKAITNSGIVNTLSLLAVLLSLPSVLESLLKNVPSKSKKKKLKIRLKGQCPKCYESTTFNVYEE